MVNIQQGMEDAIESAYDVFNELIQRTEIHLSKKLTRKLKHALKGVKIRKDFK